MTLTQAEMIKPEIIKPEDFVRLLGTRLSLYAPHADDETLGAANTLYLARKNGCDTSVFLMTAHELLSDEELREYKRIHGIMAWCKKKRISFDPDYSGEITEEDEKRFYKHTRLKEFHGVSKLLGFKPLQLLDCVKKEDDEVFGLEYVWDASVLEDGRMDSSNDDLNKILISAIRKVRPDTVFVPCREDLHNDHKAAFRAVAYASWRAGRPNHPELGKPHNVNMIVEYETVSEMENPTHLVLVDDDTLKIGRTALRIYQSQLARDPTYATRWEARLRRRGGSVGAKYAEAFRIGTPEGILKTI
jgi:LmbE family N-acetylglucosaminyl deacetylase